MREEWEEIILKTTNRKQTNSSLIELDKKPWSLRLPSYILKGLNCPSQYNIWASQNLQNVQPHYKSARTIFLTRLLEDVSISFLQSGNLIRKD